MPSTALTTPSSVEKWTARSRMLRTGSRDGLDAAIDSAASTLRADPALGRIERVAKAVGDERPERGRRRLEPEAEERERRLGEDRGRGDQRHVDDDRAHRVRKHVPEDDPEVARAGGLRRLDVLLL